jgi:hypothetical protein
LFLTLSDLYAGGPGSEQVTLRLFDSSECGDVALNSLVEADYFTPLVKELRHLDKVGYKGTVNRRRRADWVWESAKTDAEK